MAESNVFAPTKTVQVSPNSRVVAAARALMILGVCSAVMYAGTAAWLLLFLPYAAPVNIELQGQIEMGVLDAVLFVVQLGILRGAWQMYRDGTGRWAWVAAATCAVPGVSPMGVLGVPFGLWALWCLRGESKRTNSTNRSTRPRFDQRPDAQLPGYDARTG